MLVYLVDHRVGSSRDELLEGAGATRSPAVRAVGNVRTLPGARRRSTGQRFIQTVYGRGYRRATVG
jgi:DNA-binding winged helix-turn-helix (wHTH) protein